MCVCVCVWGCVGTSIGLPDLNLHMCVSLSHSLFLSHTLSLSHTHTHLTPTHIPALCTGACLFYTPSLSHTHTHTHISLSHALTHAGESVSVGLPTVICRYLPLFVCVSASVSLTLSHMHRYYYIYWACYRSLRVYVRLSHSLTHSLSHAYVLQGGEDS